MATTHKKPKGLGRGLEALLGGNDDAASSPGNGTPTTLKLTQLQAGKYQPRTRMDEGSLYELAESIKSQGIMQPILVRTVSANKYEIIAGERRYRAAKIAGLDEVPVLVKDVADENAAIMALIENIQREDLNPLEEAQGIERLVKEFTLTHEQAAQAVGRSRSAVTNLLRLLQLADPVQGLLMAGDIEMGHARALLPLPKAEQIIAANEVVSKKLSVREAEKLATAHASPQGRQKAMRLKTEKSGDIKQLEGELSDLLTAPVEVRLKAKTRRGQSGELAISFDSYDQLDAILARVRGG
jgi:ParB family chromosome partitioning protein